VLGHKDPKELIGKCLANLGDAVEVQDDMLEIF